MPGFVMVRRRNSFVVCQGRLPYLPDARREIEVLENIGTPEVKRVLQRLAEGAPEAQQTRKARASLVRFGMLAKPASLPTVLLGGNLRRACRQSPPL